MNKTYLDQFGLNLAVDEKAIAENLVSQVKNIRNLQNDELLKEIIRYATMDRLTNPELLFLRKLREEKKRRQLRHSNEDLVVLKRQLQRSAADIARIQKEVAVIVKAYKGYRFNGKVSKKLKNISGQEFKLAPGTVFCLRANSSKKGQMRMVIPQLGESNLFSLEKNLADLILNKSKEYTGDVQKLFDKFNNINKETVPLTNKQKFILLVSGYTEEGKPFKVLKGYAKVTSLTTKAGPVKKGADFVYYKVTDKTTAKDVKKERNSLKAKIEPLLLKSGVRKYSISIWDCKSKKPLLKSQNRLATKYEKLPLNLSTLDRLGIL